MPTAARTNRLDPATSRLLAQGGDARIAIGAGGVNAYGCGARPDPALVALGSSTASVVSGSGFAAAAALHARLLRDPHGHDAELERVRERIAMLSGAAAVAGSEVVLAASGTDILLIARLLAQGPRGAPTIAVMGEPAETGSGVPAALAGRHFGDDTCCGQVVERGAPALPGAAQAPASVALRRADGMPRPIEEIDAEFTQRVDELVRGGARCLLVLTDVSKTGLVAPSPDCARALARRHGPAIEVLVDACQLRLSPQSIAAYLDDGFLVAVTGSKFATGPTFCGALLLPPDVARRARRVPLQALRPYSARAHWPATWAAADALPDAANPGLLLRWEAALAELTAFAELPAGFAETFLVRWGAAVAARIADDPGLQALQVPGLRRHRAAPGWDSLPTIFPFLVVGRRDDGSAGPIDRPATLHLHRRLQGRDADAPRAERFQLGQPVACGVRDGSDVSALRVCASARNIVAAAHGTNGVDRAIASTLRAFDRLATLSRERRPALA